MLKFRLSGSQRTRRARRKSHSLEALEPRLVLSAFSIGSPDVIRETVVALDSSDGLYVAGTFRDIIDLDPGPGVFEVTSGGDTFGDAFFAKYDLDGNFQWGGAYEDAVIGDMKVNAGGDVVLVGSFRGVVDFDLSDGVQTLDAGTRQAAFITTYNANGELEVRQQLGGGTTSGVSFVSGQAVALDNAGNIYTTGSMSRGSADFDPGSGVFTLANGSGNNDTFISKLDAGGNFVWAKKFTNDKTIAAGVWPYDIAVDSSQNVFVTGIYVGRADFDPSAGDYTLTADGGVNRGGDGYVARLNPDGSLGYAVRTGSNNGREDTYSVSADADGNAYITGTMNSGGAIYGTNGTYSVTSAGRSDGYLAKLNINGAVAWANRFGGSSSDGGSRVAIDSNGSIFVAGYYTGSASFSSPSGSQQLTAKGSVDSFAMRTDSNGSILDLWEIGGTGYDYVEGLAHGPNGKVALTGRFSESGDFELGDGVTTLTAVGGADAFVSVLERNTGNQAPIAEDGSLTTDEDTNQTGTLVAVDPEGAALTFEVEDRTNLNGFISLNRSTGNYTYAPAANFNGTASFTFTASDGVTKSEPATVVITVNSVEDAPTASDRTISVNEDSFVTAALFGYDGDGDILTYEIVDDSNANGTVEILNATSGSVRYTPIANFNGTASFAFRVNDGDQFSNVATVTVNVVNAYDRPVAQDGQLAAVEDTVSTGMLTAENIDNYALTYRIADTADAHGTVRIIDASTGEYSYTPDANYFGSASFVFFVSDGQTSSSATISIDVAAVNDAPELSGGSFEIEENSADGTVVGTVTGSDVDDAQLVYSILSGNTGSGFAIDATTGQITVNNSAALDFETNPVFEVVVEARDSGSLTDTAVVTINLTDVVETRTLRMDILSDSFRTKGRGKVEVAIFGEADFDVRSIDVATVRFGATGTEDSLSHHKKRGARVSYRDVNGDGIVDVAFTFEIRRAGFSRGDTMGFFTAKTLDGQDLFAEDAVNVR